MTRIESIREKIQKHRLWVGSGAAAVAFLLVLALALGTGTRDMALLYSGLDEATSGEVVAALEASGVTFEIKGNAIWVPTADRDKLRMQLASQGLPKSDIAGYELLDSLSGFGTTSQMFDAAYWRAKEGELARTILASPGIRSARVHISASNSRPFARELKTTAAVTITTNGNTLAKPQIDALRYLVASAVAGLTTEDVAVIDSVKGLLTGEDTNVGTTVENDLKDRVERLLEARVGVGNAVVAVSIDTINDTEQIVERRIDPASRIAISSDVVESTTTSSDASGGPVTVASNLPDSEAAQKTSSGETSETRTLTNYEVSELRREVTRNPGEIRRMTVAVMINDTAEGRSDDEIQALNALVAAAVGFDEARGDEITLYALPFQVPADQGSLAEVATGNSIDLTRVITVALASVVALILGLFLVRPLLLGRTNPAAGSVPEPDTGPENLLDHRDDLQITEDPAERLRRLIGERQRDSIKLLQSWVDPTNKGHV